MAVPLDRVEFGQSTVAMTIRTWLWPIDEYFNRRSTGVSVPLRLTPGVHPPLVKRPLEDLTDGNTHLRTAEPEGSTRALRHGRRQSLR